MAEDISGGGSGIGGLAQLVGALSPLFLGNKQTQTISGNPADVAANNAMIAQLMPRATGGVDSSIYGPLVDNIMRRAAIAFAPTRGVQTASGGYNSTALKQLQQESEARAGGEAASAVLQSQSDASRTIAQLLSANTAANRTVATKTPPQVPSAITLGLLGLAGARSLFPKTSAAVNSKVAGAGQSFEDSILNLFKKNNTNVLGSDAGPNIGGGISYGGNDAFSGSGAGAGAGGFNTSQSFLSSNDELSGFGQITNNELFNTIDLAASNASANAAIPFSAPAVISADAANPGEIQSIAPSLEGYSGHEIPPGSPTAGLGGISYSGAATSGAASGVGSAIGGPQDAGIIDVDLGDIAGGAQSTADPNIFADVDLGLSPAAGSLSAALPYVGPAVQVATGNYEGAIGSIVGGAFGGPVGAVAGSIAAPAAGILNNEVRNGLIADDPDNALGQLAQGFAPLDPAGAGVDAVHTGDFGSLIPDPGEALSALDDTRVGIGDLLSSPGDALSFASDLGGKAANIFGTVICTELYKQGKLTKAEYLADMRWGQKNVSETTFRGYHFWAKPVVLAMQRSKMASKIAEFFFLPWAKQLSGQRSIYGATLRVVGPAVCYVLGTILEVLDPKVVEA